MSLLDPLVIFLVVEFAAVMVLLVVWLDPTLTCVHVALCGYIAPELVDLNGWMNRNAGSPVDPKQVKTGDGQGKR